MQTKELSPASRVIFDGLLREVREAQVKLQQFLNYTAAAMSVNVASWEFNFDTGAFQEKSAPPAPEPPPAEEPAYAPAEEPTPLL